MPIIERKTSNIVPSASRSTPNLHDAPAICVSLRRHGCCDVTAPWVRVVTPAVGSYTTLLIPPVFLIYYYLFYSQIISYVEKETRNIVPSPPPAAAPLICIAHPRCACHCARCDVTAPRRVSNQPSNLPNPPFT